MGRQIFMSSRPARTTLLKPYLKKSKKGKEDLESIVVHIFLSLEEQANLQEWLCKRRMGLGGDRDVNC